MATIQELVRKLNITEAEAKQVLLDDAAIDKGAYLFPLTKEQKQAEKKMRAAGKVPTAYKFTKRERKADNDKQHLINLLVEAVGTPVEIIYAESEFYFVFNDKKYKVVLSAPRT